MFEFGSYAYGVFLPAALRLGGVGLLSVAGRGDLVDLLRLEVAVLACALLAMLGLSPIRGLMAGWAMDQGIVRKLVSFSAPLYANSILFFLSGRLNLFLLAGLTSPVQVANYGAAWQVPDGCARILQALVAAYFPFAAKLSGDADHRGAARLTEFVLALAASGTVLCVVIAALFGPEILAALLGASYRPAATVFALLMASFSLQSLISVMGYSLVAAGHPGVTTTINTFGMLVLLAGGLAAIPAAGAAGAACALVGANAVVLALSWRALSRRGSRIDGMSFLMPLALGGLCVGLGQSAESIAGRLAIGGLYLLICGILSKELRVSIRFLVTEGVLLIHRFRAMLSRAPQS
jgi:O-antigen/teichoic acid export membrane protein